ncbi:MAG: NAD(P)-dependent oxidoreductase [Nitrososphaerota archaeon]|jgi:UDP-glucose 4-epimerase|nr:NAD(P)-dependent oxidoreductase [Nitrososphaerota archaeon]MDG6947241.1 NAD(P)-dependent oxidoreductase [Nitrososphaerota archaeon]MDG6955326.1 NAD(P)-dependent oxidoreductase [Nitrososphaerota archaeon]
MAKVLVTGGTGQVGGFVCRELANRGHEVVVYDVNPNMQNLVGVRNVKVVNGDTVDIEELMGAIRRSRATHLVHLAAMVVIESKERPAKASKVNCIGMVNVLEAGRILDLERIVFASSITVYGGPKAYPAMVVDEDDFPQCPADPYSVTKFMNEKYGEYYHDAYGLDLLCLRIAAAWGPGRYTGYTGQFNSFVRDVATGKSAKFPEDFAYSGAKLRWLYVKDVARAFVHGIEVEEKSIKRSVYNLGNNEPFKAADVVEGLTNILPDSVIGFEETREPTRISAGIAGTSGLDVECGRLYEDLGFREELGLRGGLRDMVQFERSKAGLPPIGAWAGRKGR